MYAVITGASSGFGKEFAKRFASLGYDLCLTGLNEAGLSQIKVDLEKRHKVKIDVLQVDLSKNEEMDKLYDFTKVKNVDVLINNAGIAIGGKPADIDIDKEMEMLTINVRAVHYLTRRYLADMLKENKGKILNVSSLSAWLPTPFLSAYAAGKAYILHLSEGLNFELKETKSRVRVSVVTPGFFNTGIANGQGGIAKQSRSLKNYIEKVVQQFLEGKEVIILGQDKKIGVLKYFMPRPIAKRIMYRGFIRGIRV